MTNLIYTAKSGTTGDWTENDLEAYNIVLKLENALTFFRVDELPPPSVDQELLTVQDAGRHAVRAQLQLDLSR